jgi:XTP/dITP diphosphohydrolase
MWKIVVATHNKGKLKEIKELLKVLKDYDVELVGLDSFPGIPMVREDGNTFYENALKKAHYVAEYSGLPAIADDSGLEVDALEGKPGVYSSRFAGENATDEDNNVKLLEMLKGVPYDKRTARFKCVAVLYIPDGATEATIITAEGVCEGIIGMEPKGTAGFGYDPLFVVPEFGKTFAELGEDTKNRISHRAEAFKKLCQSVEVVARKS